MRTVNDVIKYVNDIKPNAFTDDTLTEWLSECEGSIQTEILCIASGDVVTYNYADNKDTELIVKPPHDKLYGFYLLAMIDFAHGEYKKYENTMQLFNAALSEFAKWFVRTHSKEAKNPEGYYMSGYDLAVKHGYSGTEEEWLKTLIGPQGVQGIQGEKGDRGIPGKIQSVTSGDNGKILVDGESVVVYDDSEIKEEIGGKVDKVQGKGLSSNDYTAEEKTKLSELPTKTELDTDLSGKEDSANKVTTLDSNGTDTQYPSAKAVYDELVKKADMQTQNGGVHVGGGIDGLVVGHGVGIGYNVYVGDDKGCAIGEYTATNADGCALGGGAMANGGCAIGKGALTGDGFAGGRNAETVDTVSGRPIDAIQLGTGTNPNEKTLQIYDYQLLDAGGHIPNERMPTKEDKTTITTSTETTASITLADNTEFIFTAELEELEIALPQNATEPYICSVVFNSGETPTGGVYAPGSIYFKGINCTGSTFTPTANKHYTLMFVYDSMELICYVSAKPINEIILFSTADTDEASVMSDESTAEESESVMETSESVAEEPESEPNEVI